MADPKILFVCLGNICRSPMAQCVMRFLSLEAGKKLTLDSAGTGPWHAGKGADARMAKAARSRGYDLSRHEARQVELADFYEFTHIYAMDRSNYADLLRMAPPNATATLALFRADEDDVPDPYYGGAEGFARVIDLAEAECARILKEVTA